MMRYLYSLVIQTSLVVRSYDGLPFENFDPLVAVQASLGPLNDDDQVIDSILSTLLKYCRILSWYTYEYFKLIGAK